MTSDGGNLSVGSISYIDLDSGNRQEDGLIIKLDQFYQKQFVVTLGENGNDYINQAIECDQGDYYMVGNRLNNLSRLVNQDGWLVKMNSKGQVEWQQYYGNEKHNHLVDIKEDQNGQLVILGYSKRTNEDTNKDYFLLRYQKDGLLLNEMPLINLRGSLNALEIGKDNQVYMIGETVSEDKSGYFIKVNEKGEIVFTKIFNQIDSQQREFIFKNLLPIDNQNWYIIGGVSQAENQLYHNGIMLKVNNQGDLISLLEYPQESSAIFNQAVRLDDERLLVNDYLEYYEDNTLTLKRSDLLVIDTTKGDIIQSLLDESDVFEIRSFDMINDYQISMIQIHQLTRLELLADRPNFVKIVRREQMIPHLFLKSNFMSVKINEKPNLMELYNATAADPKQGDLTNAIEIYDGDVDYQKPGYYPIIFSVTNEYGNNVYKEVTIHIAREDQASLNQQVIIIIIVGSLIFIFILLVNHQRIKQKTS